MPSVKRLFSTLSPAGRSLISILRIIGSLLESKKRCGIRGRGHHSLSLLVIKQPERQLRALDSQGHMPANLGIALAAEVSQLSPGEVEPHARDRNLHYDLRSHRTFGHRAPNGISRHFSSCDFHHPDNSDTATVTYGSVSSCPLVAAALAEFCSWAQRTCFPKAAAAIC